MCLWIYSQAQRFILLMNPSEIYLFVTMILLFHIFSFLEFLYLWLCLLLCSYIFSFLSHWHPQHIHCSCFLLLVCWLQRSCPVWLWLWCLLCFFRLCFLPFSYTIWSFVGSQARCIWEREPVVTRRSVMWLGWGCWGSILWTCDDPGLLECDLASQWLLSQPHHPSRWGTLACG